MTKKALFLIFFLTISIRFPSLVYAGEGHDAGYEWASENYIGDESSCYDVSGEPINNSESFTEGCLQYVEEQRVSQIEDDEESEDEYENEEDTL